VSQEDFNFTQHFTGIQSLLDQVQQRAFEQQGKNKYQV